MGRAWRSSSRASTRSPEAGLAISSTAITRPFRIWIPGSGCVCAAFCVSVRSGAVGAEGAIISAGPMLSLPRRGCSLLHKPRRRCVNPLGGEPPTGEPDAGEPPVRFGGRGNEINRFSLPLYFRSSATRTPCSFVDFLSDQLRQNLHRLLHFFICIKEMRRHAEPDAGARIDEDASLSKPLDHHRAGLHINHY